MLEYLLLKRAERIRRVGDYLDEVVLPLAQRLKVDSIHLEIGCGHGHWLSSFAASRSMEVFVGIDIIQKRICRSLRKKELCNLPNLHFIKTEAWEFLEAAKGKLKISDTYLMYPDPWPKKRHHKRRLVQIPFLQTLAEVSSPEARFFLKTDSIDYFEWAGVLLKDSPNWSPTSEKWPHEQRSVFENLFSHSFVCSAQKITISS